MERFFNTAGPQILEDNYSIDPLSRFDLDDIMTLIRQFTRLSGRRAPDCLRPHQRKDMGRANLAQAIRTGRPQDYGLGNVGD